jgi:hypothetical protein
MKQQKQNNSHDGVNPLYAQLERNHEDQLAIEADMYFELTARGFTSEHARHHAAEVAQKIGGLVE